MASCVETTVAAQQNGRVVGEESGHHRCTYHCQPTIPYELSQSLCLSLANLYFFKLLRHWWGLNCVL